MTSRYFVHILPAILLLIPACKSASCTNAKALPANSFIIDLPNGQSYMIIPDATRFNDIIGLRLSDFENEVRNALKSTPSATSKSSIEDLVFSDYSPPSIEPAKPSYGGPRYLHIKDFANVDLLPKSKAAPTRR